MSEKKIVKSSEIDSNFKYEVSGFPGAERIMRCFQCGTCSANCPIEKFSEFYKPRRIARMVQLGLRERLLSDDHLWLCSGCFTCIDHCPQNVEPASVIRAIRNLVVKERNRMPLVSKELATNLLKTGYVYAMSESRMKRRMENGLPPLPKANLKEVESIFNTLGLTRLLEGVETFEKVD